MNQVIIQMAIVQARMRRLLVLLAAAMLALACGGRSDLGKPTPAPEQAPACPPVACGWAADGTCPDDVNTFSYENSSVELDDGTKCWVFTAACIGKSDEPVDAACIPDSCKQNQFTTCEPTRGAL